MEQPGPGALKRSPYTTYLALREVSASGGSTVYKSARVIISKRKGSYQCANCIEAAPQCLILKYQLALKKFDVPRKPERMTEGRRTTAHRQTMQSVGQQGGGLCLFVKWNVKCSLNDGVYQCLSDIFKDTTFDEVYHFVAGTGALPGYQRFLPIFRGAVSAEGRQTDQKAA